MAELTPIQFLQKLKQCVKEYKKQSLDTRDDSATAHFFNPALKNFLKNNPDEMKILSEINFEKAFMSWVKMYLLK